MTNPVSRRRQGRITALSFALLAGTSLGLAAPQAHADQAPNSAPSAAAPVSRSTEAQALNESAAVQKNFKPLPSFEPLVKLVRPAVVSVTVHLKVQNQASQGQGEQGPPGLPFPFPFPFPHPKVP